jgi:CBS domain-containing protein
LEEVRRYIHPHALERFLLSVEGDKTVTEALIIMRDNHLESVIVTKKGKPVGIFTGGDVMTKVLFKGLKPEETKVMNVMSDVAETYCALPLMFVKEIMSSPVETIKPEATVAEAIRLMGDKHIGSLVVVKEEQPIGIFTERDLLSKVLAKGMDINTTEIGTAMSTPIILGDAVTSICEAVRFMKHTKIRRLPLMENGKLVGIVTASDVLTYIASY